jgi:hypothetical protein
MTRSTIMDWPAMVLLGAFHGINPGMGWLFAVALGMQQGSGRGVWRALLPIALGHALAVGVVVVAAGIARLVLPIDTLRAHIAVMLCALGLYRLWRHRHPRSGGMQVAFRDLAGWSFLMASAHGAGFMVLPFLMPSRATLSAATHEHAGHIVASGSTVMADVSAVAIHTLTYLAVLGLAAWIVYRWLGLSLLRKAWFDMDRVWAGALMVTGILVLST